MVSFSLDAQSSGIVMSESRAKLEGVDDAGIAVPPCALETKEFRPGTALAGGLGAWHAEARAIGSR